MRQGARDFRKLEASRKSAPEVIWGVLVGRYCPNKREAGTDKLFQRETRKTTLIRTGTWCRHPNVGFEPGYRLVTGQAVRTSRSLESRGFDRSCPRFVAGRANAAELPGYPFSPI